MIVQSHIKKEFLDSLNIRTAESNVWQYHPRQRSISVFVCSARMFTLKCGEHLFGDDHESSQTFLSGNVNKPIKAQKKTPN